MSPTRTSPPEIPTVAAVRASEARFSNDPRHGPAERALTRVFRLFPANSAIEDVLTKVVLLNSLYSTNVYAVADMAEHILTLGIDAALAAGSLDIVDTIANLAASKGGLGDSKRLPPVGGDHEPPGMKAALLHIARPTNSPARRERGLTGDPPGPACSFPGP